MNFGTENWTHAFAQNGPTQVTIAMVALGHEIATGASVEDDSGGCRFEGAQGVRASGRRARSGNR